MENRPEILSQADAILSRITSAGSSETAAALLERADSLLERVSKSTTKTKSTSAAVVFTDHLKIETRHAGRSIYQLQPGRIAPRPS